jgi:hypothetical protein
VVGPIACRAVEHPLWPSPSTALRTGSSKYERALRQLALRLPALLLPTLLLSAAPAHAKDLDRNIPDLFGGSLSTTIDPTARKDVQQVGVAERFRGLSSSLAAARSQAPIPSASGAFRFAWDPDLDTFVRQPQGLGSMFAERATTLGRNVFTLAFSYTRVDFDTLDGDSLNDIRASQPALTPDYLAQLPPDDQAMFADDVLETQLDLDFGFDLSDPGAGDGRITLGELAGGFADAARAAVLHLFRRAEVVAAGEVAARALHDDDLDAGIGIGEVHRAIEVIEQPPGLRVFVMRAVEGDPADRAIGLERAIAEFGGCGHQVLRGGVSWDAVYALGTAAGGRSAAI